MRVSGAGDHEAAAGDADADDVVGCEAGVRELEATQADQRDFAFEGVRAVVDGRVVSRTDADALCGRCC